MINIALPPLRERLEDIPLLADYLLERYCRKNGKPLKRLSRKSQEILKSYDWPGNIRELENVISRAVVFSDQDVIEPAVLPSALTMAEEPTSMVQIPYGMTLNDVDNQVIEATLRRTNGDKKLAAKKLGVSLRTIYRKLG